jgi:hypothetical protein
VNKQLWASGLQRFIEEKKNSENRILLVQGFKKLKEDLTGSSNSKSFSVKAITGTD